MAGVTPRLKRKSTKRKYRYDDDDDQDKIPQTQYAKVIKTCNISITISRSYKCKMESISIHYFGLLIVEKRVSIT